MQHAMQLRFCRHCTQPNDPDLQGSAEATNDFDLMTHYITLRALFSFIILCSSRKLIWHTDGVLKTMSLPIIYQIKKKVASTQSAACKAAIISDLWRNDSVNLIKIEETKPNRLTSNYRINLCSGTFTMHHTYVV